MNQTHPAPPVRQTVFAAAVCAGLLFVSIAWLDDPPCTDPGVRCQRDVWERVRRATYDIIDNVTIADLAEKDREAVAAPRYYI